MKGFLITTASHDERWFEHIVTAFYVLIFLITFITNLFLFMVFLRNKSFRDLSTYLIVQMAGADVLYLSVTCAIITIKNLEVELSRSTCKALLYVEGTARFTSSLSLMLISLERSMSVCSPTLCYSIRKISGVKKKAFFSVVITSLILRVGVLFVACDSEKWAPGYRLAVTAATYTFPLVVELIAYFIAYHNINRRIKTSTGAASMKVLLFIRKSLRVFVLIAVVFAVCTLPSSILVILQSLHLYTPSYFVGYMGDMIECIPCVTDVICYVACSPKFRMEIKKLLSRLSLCKTKETFPKSTSAEGAPDEDCSENETGHQTRKNRAINRATLKLDWVLGDDPSQIVIPASPPRTDSPAFFAPSDLGDLMAAAQIGLETITEQEEAVPARVMPRNFNVGTWPRMRQTLPDRSPLVDPAISVESVLSGWTSGVDSGVCKSGSEAGLSTVTTDLPKSSEQALTNHDKGTQTEINVEEHATVQEESSWL